MGKAGGYLTTHVLDTARGVPAKGIRIELFRLSGDGREKIAETVTNNDGRTDSPILPADSFGTGIFELVFHAGDYIRMHGLAMPVAGGPLFLEEIPIRFGIDDAAAHYHVPLLLSPFGYSTYRGS
ncbi:hydroxyisourate hydrolase [Zhengella sp. ZM62]|uniref:hydroxyisourate hydrolase n=1 Tax=Zhengella sedimenti TaxID=3390035 RepID=UPI0039753FA7